MKKVLLSLCFVVISCITNAQTPVWGMTQSGGASSGGTIFTINSDGTGFKTEFNFASPSGWKPIGNLMQASNGLLYGTCYEGGMYASCTVFSHSPSTGTHFDVYDFDITHGDYPQSGLIEGPNQVLYGVASSGGSNSAGVLYSYTIATNTYADIYNFSSTSGSNPINTPLLSYGKLYGTATHGGTHSYGTIFSFDLAANTYTDLYDFDNTVAGSNPNGGLILVGNKLYGMTFAGGQNGLGTIYSYTPASNTFAKLYDFKSALGGQPKGALLLGMNGILYGVTSTGGTSNMGVLFSFDPASSTYTDLFNFVTSTGSAPMCDLFKVSDKLYGSTSTGGINGYGALFSFDLIYNVYSDMMNFNQANGSTPSGGFMMASEITSVPTGCTPQSLFTLYPNPIRTELNILTLNTEASEITFYDNASKELMKQNFSGNTTIDASQLAAGIYQYQIKNRNGIVTKGTIMKQ